MLINFLFVWLFVCGCCCCFNSALIFVVVVVVVVVVVAVVVVVFHNVLTVTWPIETDPSR